MDAINNKELLSNKRDRNNIFMFGVFILLAAVVLYTFGSCSESFAIFGKKGKKGKKGKRGKKGKKGKKDVKAENQKLSRRLEDCFVKREQAENRLNTALLNIKDLSMCKFVKDAYKSGVSGNVGVDMYVKDPEDPEKEYMSSVYLIREDVVEKCKKYDNIFG